MNIKKMFEDVNVDLNSMADSTVKELVIKLVNGIEALTIENEYLRHEYHRLKGQQGQIPSSASLIKSRSEGLTKGM